MRIENCIILKNKITVINMEEVLNLFEEQLERLSGQYVCVCNVHTTVTSYEDDVYRKAQNNAILNLPDGKPISVIGRRHGYNTMGRVAGPDLMQEVFRRSVQNGWKHYFYGSTSEILELLQERMKKDYQGICVVGAYAPPFRELTDEENSKVVSDINEKKPDFIWVGLGAPKQELFMYEHRGMLSGVMIGVGAGFNFHAGTVKRAPAWMQRLGLEWFYRMLQEPRRLWKRYMRTNLKFLWLVNKKGMVR